ncbi:MAG: cation diffusion facilitator family transporter [Bulleidia sp.]
MTDLLVKLFVKDAENIEDEKVRFNYGMLSSCTGIVCNIFLFVLKLVSGFLMNSVTIISDGFNNLSDCMSCLITMLGYRLASRPADREHPFGHGRYEYVVSFCVAVMIIVVTFQLFLESVDKIIHPGVVRFDPVLFVLLAASMLVKVWMSAFNTKLGRKLNNLVMITTAKDSRNDVAVTALSLVAMALAAFVPGIPFDGIFGIVLAFILFMSGVNMIRDILDHLLGAPADAQMTRKIRDEIMAVPEIVGVHDMIIHDYGPGCHIGSAHAEVDAHMDFLHAHDIIDECERTIQEKHHVMMTLHLDPVDYTNPLVNGYREDVTRVLRELNCGLSMHDFRAVTGPTHTNLVFDILMPFCCKCSEETIRKTIDETMAKIHPETKIYTVITFDRSYIEEA